MRKKPKLVKICEKKEIKLLKKFWNRIIFNYFYGEIIPIQVKHYSSICIVIQIVKFLQLAASFYIDT